nr:hypothetical protein [uncultured Cetobacterium sp.]
MDIFINDERVNFKLKEKQVGPMIEEIQEYLSKEGKVLAELKINGVKIANEQVEISGAIYLVEIKSRTHRELVIESLYYLEKYADKFFDILDSPTDEIDANQLYDMIGFIEWCLGVLYSMKEVTNIPFIYSDFDEYLNDFKNSTDELIDSFKAGDYERVMEILEMEVISYIQDFEANGPDYLKEIMDEEARKNLLN